MALDDRARRPGPAQRRWDGPRLPAELSLDGRLPERGHERPRLRRRPGPSGAGRGRGEVLVLRPRRRCRPRLAEAAGQPRDPADAGGAPRSRQRP